MPGTRILISILLTLFTQVALAELSLDTAKAQGLVGEDASGYLAAVGTANQEVRSLINSVNGRREEQYDKIADANDIDITAVEQLAGKKAIEKTSPGQYVRLPGGDWQLK